MKTLPLTVCILFSFNSGLAQSTQANEPPPLKSQGTSISTYGIIAKNLIGFLTSYSAAHGGKAPSSWADMESDGLRLEQFEQNYGVALPEVYSFIQSSGTVPDFNRGKPIIIHTAPVDYRSKGSEGRYVIWRGANGGYEFSRLPEVEIQQLIVDYNIVLSPPSAPKVAGHLAEKKPLPDAGELAPKSAITVDAQPMEPIPSPRSAPMRYQGYLWWTLGCVVLLGAVLIGLRNRSK